MVLVLACLAEAKRRRVLEYGCCFEDEDEDENEHEKEPTRFRPDTAQVTPMPAPHTSRQRSFLISAGLALLVLLAFEPVRHNAFVEFDDNQYLLENTHIHSGFTAESVIWAFTSGYASNWHPLTWLSHMLDIQLFGLNPLAHHLHNVLLHALATVLLFLVLNRMTSLRPAHDGASSAPTGAVWCSAFVAMAFAIHPLRVESVAWVAERKDVLSGVFFMLTLWAYERYASGSKFQVPSSRLWYGCALAFFTLSLLSKPMAVTLPFVLLLLDFWPLQRVSGVRCQVSGEEETSKLDDHASRTTHYALRTAPPRLGFGDWGLVIGEKIPFLALALASCVVTYLVQQHGKSMTPDLPLAFRISNALTSYVAYLGKLVWPANLAVLYPYPVKWPLWKPVAAALVLVFFSAFIWSRRSRQPWLVAGWLWYLATLIPVIGLVQVGAQSMADRYTYLPSVGIFIMVAWGAAAVSAEWRQQRFILTGCGALMAMAMVAATRTQVKWWGDSVTLFEHAVTVTENNHTMHHSLGWVLARENRLDEAAVHLRRSLELRPDPETTLDLADVLIRCNQFDEAMNYLDELLQARPTHSLAHYNKGIIYQTREQSEEAIKAYEQAVRFDTNNARAFNNLGMLKAQQGLLEEAAGCFHQSLRSAPDNAATHRNLAAVLQMQGRTDEAVSHCRAALRIDPNDAETSWQLAFGLHALGRFREAAEQDRRTLRLNPDHVQTLNDLAWILATAPDPGLRNPGDAVALARKTCELTGFKEPEFMDTLAAAHAGAGQFEEATETARNAFELAKVAGQEDLARDIEQRLQLYQTSKPYHESRLSIPTTGSALEP